ncbi:MAG: hypothetical protein QOC77_3472 [Thermoleophilaceae bacterium]|nr:hypothetical protein [Thermoleophilaceae bacterium]
MTPWSHLWRERGLGAAVKRAVGRPLPARVVWGLRRPLRGADPLVTPPSGIGPEALADPFLRERLAGRELGVWTLSAHAIDTLVATVRARRPQLAVEFSSGVSTLALAHAMRSFGEPPWVISVEQDAAHAGATRELLRESGLGDAAVVLHAPLVKRDGRSAYDLDARVLAGHIAGRAVGIAVVDGPAAEEGARVTTLPMLCPHLVAPCPLLLDDALRDGELRAARWWQRAGIIEDAQYDLREGGLMTATLLPCQSR